MPSPQSDGEVANAAVPIAEQVHRLAVKYEIPTALVIELVGTTVLSMYLWRKKGRKPRPKFSVRLIRVGRAIIAAAKAKELPYINDRLTREERRSKLRDLLLQYISE